MGNKNLENGEVDYLVVINWTYIVSLGDEEVIGIEH